MAKASIEIICSECGKTFKHERRDLRNRKDADDYEEWAKANIILCPECYAKKVAEEKQKKIADAMGNIVLAELEGTEKQVAWAKKIREQFIYECLKDEPLPVFFDTVNAKTKASWWIETRNNTRYDFLVALFG